MYYQHKKNGTEEIFSLQNESSGKSIRHCSPMYTFTAHDEFQRAWLALPLKPYCLIPVVSLLGCMNLVTAAILVKIPCFIHVQLSWISSAT